jgi:RNA polymerase sigma-70 factor (ECF subfamily)
MPLTHPLDHAAATFSGLRPRLFGIAYRMLGSAAEAEDVVQEVWLRWQATDRSLVRDPAAFLATTTTRLALNVAQSARSRRETYVGQWLPEPVDTRDDPALGAERSEALEFAVLLLLEKLRPRERAVYVLSEAFDYSYAQIAEILQLTEAHARQLASRARKFLVGERRQAVSAEQHRRLLDAFLGAARAGDRAGLEQLLASSVVSYSDGGGLAVAAPRPIAGPPSARAGSTGRRCPSSGRSPWRGRGSSARSSCSSGTPSSGTRTTISPSTGRSPRCSASSTGRTCPSSSPSA